MRSALRLRHAVRVVNPGRVVHHQQAPRLELDLIRRRGAALARTVIRRVAPSETSAIGTFFRIVEVVVATDARASGISWGTAGELRIGP